MKIFLINNHWGEDAIRLYNHHGIITPEPGVEYTIRKVQFHHVQTEQLILFLNEIVNKPIGKFEIGWHYSRFGTTPEPESVLNWEDMREIAIAAHDVPQISNETA